MSPSSRHSTLYGNRVSKDTELGHLQNQQKHHARKTFRDEYIELLKKFEIEYDDRFLFKPVEG
jgi:putative transposase